MLYKFYIAIEEHPRGDTAEKTSRFQIPDIAGNAIAEIQPREDFSTGGDPRAMIYARHDLADDR